MNESGDMVRPLFGRERELAAVCELLAEAACRGAALLVRGRAGMGRSSLLAAGAAAGVPRASAEEFAPAVAADLIDVTGSVFRFSHPLVRSAVYYAAPLSERHAAHAALAGVLAYRPERAAWHAAANVTRPDETVAGEMELAARRALGHGGVVAALAAAERAVTLTADPAARGGRLRGPHAVDVA